MNKIRQNVSNWLVQIKLAPWVQVFTSYAYKSLSRGKRGVKSLEFVSTFYWRVKIHDHNDNLFFWPSTCQKIYSFIGNDTNVQMSGAAKLRRVPSDSAPAARAQTPAPAQLRRWAVSRAQSGTRVITGGYLAQWHHEHHQDSKSWHVRISYCESRKLALSALSYLSYQYSLTWGILVNWFN